MQSFSSDSLARPRSGYSASISEQAGALMQSLAGNHAFIDGNERVAFAAVAVLLRTNGYRLDVRRRRRRAIPRR
jgi:death-on-curing protein